MKLSFLTCGFLDADRSVIHPTDDSHRRVTLPVGSVLIENQGRRILIDTGMPVQSHNDAKALQREYGIDPAWIVFSGSPEQRIDAQLKRHALGQADLNLVINTHLHFDHCGGNALFADTPIAVQEDELIAARETDSYLPVWDAPDLRFMPVRGDWSPIPGVEMLFTPGHSDGHQSMLVRFPDGPPWLFTFDAVYTEEHWRENKLGAVKDVTQARASMDRLRQTAARERAKVIFGHDIVQWEALTSRDASCDGSDI